MKTLLKQSKLNEKLILNEDEDILLADDENVGESKIYNTEDRIKELQAIKKERPLTDEELEELAYCKNEVDSREAETKYLNSESLKEDTNIHYDRIYAISAEVKGEQNIYYVQAYYYDDAVDTLFNYLIKNYPVAKEDIIISKYNPISFSPILKWIKENSNKVDEIIWNETESYDESLKEDKLRESKIIVYSPYTYNKDDDFYLSEEGFKNVENLDANDLFTKKIRDAYKFKNEQEATDFCKENGVDLDAISFISVEDNFPIKESLKESKEDDLLELEEPIDDEVIEDETIETDIEEPVEEVTQEVADNAYLTQLNDLITSEYGKIDEVKSIIATFDSEDAIEKNDEVISILNAFIDETTITIGMLTKASELIDSTTSDLMKQGIEKAEDAIKDIDKDKEEETEE